MPKKLFISLLVGLLLSALTLYLAFRNVPLRQLVAYLGAINYWWILPSVAIGISTFLLRTIRWQIILKDVGVINFGQAFHPLMIGFMMNCVLPGRIGELARPVLLKQKHDIGVSAGLATVAAERIFDIFMLMLLFTLVFTTITGRPDLNSDYFGFHLTSAMIKSAAFGLIRISIALLAFISLLTISTTRRWIMRTIQNFGSWTGRLIPKATAKIERLTASLLGLIENFALGLSMVRDPRRMLACTGLTVLIWALTAVSYVVFAKGCPGIGLSFMEYVTVMVVICFAIALPSVPGFWGLWEAGGVFALSLFGVNRDEALGFVLVNHAAQIFPIIAVGLISALITSVNILHLTGNDASVMQTRPAKP
jgi:glycosyltransferase 2 family protein